jgi:putative Mg2+ transporter-C (MgtC) family protein
MVAARLPLPDLRGVIDLETCLRLIAALVAGGLIGLERSYHGRPAGFRTHALVCLSTSLLMLVTVFETRWFPALSQGRVSIDPTRMAQGIMTGIGFLGAGAIIKDGLSVRGLTTAASIWITAAIGILIGIGFYGPATIASLLSLGTLSVFRWLENKLPVQFYAQLSVRFARDAALSEPEMRNLLASHGFRVANLHYHVENEAPGFFEYQMVIHASRAEKARLLTAALAGLDRITAFRMSPTGD